MSRLSVKNPEVWRVNLGLLGGLGVIGALYARQGSQVFKVAKGLSYGQPLSYLIQGAVGFCTIKNGLKVRRYNEQTQKQEIRQESAHYLGVLWLVMGVAGLSKGLNLAPWESVPLNLLGFLASGVILIGTYDSKEGVTLLSISMATHAASHLLSCMRYSPFISRDLAAFVSLAGFLSDLGRLRPRKKKVVS